MDPGVIIHTRGSMQFLNQYPPAIQALAAVAVVVATVVLAIFNWRYVKIYDAAMKISQEQLKRQSGVYARFGLRCTQHRARTGRAGGDRV